MSAEKSRWFTWNQVVIWSVILLIQLGLIGYTWQRERKGK